MHGHISGVWWVQPVDKKQQRKQVTPPRAYQIHTTRYEKMLESIQVGHAASFLSHYPAAPISFGGDMFCVSDGVDCGKISLGLIFLNFRSCCSGWIRAPRVESPS